MASIEIQTDETFAANPLHPLLSWRSILAGTLISLLGFWILGSLGIAVGSIRPSTDFASAMQGGIQASTPWVLAASMLSLFAGGYFAARVSNLRTRRIGMAQGAVIAAIFFGVFMTQSPIMLSALGRGSAALVMARGAANSLAAQAHLSTADASARIDAIDAATSGERRLLLDETESRLRRSGGDLFVTLLIGLFAAIGGGAWASRVNIRLPLSREEVPAKSYRTAYAS